MRTWRKRNAASLLCASLIWGSAFTEAAYAQNVTFAPYIQPGDASKFGAKDVMVIAWQTDETTPNSAAYTVEYGKSVLLGTTVHPKGRIVDNYLSADAQFAPLLDPTNPNGIKTLYGAHTDYYTALTGLEYDTTYYYKVTGPGLPDGGFTATFHTRKQGNVFSFEVQGDEGYYPGIPGSNPARIVNYEARIIHEMYHVAELTVSGAPALPHPDLALNTGDNVYITGCDSNYRDVWFGDWNGDLDTNDDGAPFLRSIPLYIVDGNHDVGGTGATANLLADSGATVPGAFGPGPFGGGVGGGDAMAHFNNFYFPLNGPKYTDIQNVFNGDVSTPTGFFFAFNGTNYTSPAAIEALRKSTTVNTGGGYKRQIDRESNYSFDYGNAHFVFLDANPHVFNGLLPGGPPANTPAFPFPTYPKVLRQWLIADLDSSDQLWKVIVFHQPAFSSGNATVSNDQMRRIAKFLEDHGANIVFNGHEHNYQRSLPLRSFSGVTQAPTHATSPVVAADSTFDGVTQTVPDGVLYIVQGAGGNRDFDDNIPNPRGGGLGIDQDDAATGTTTLTIAGTPHTFVNGPASWLDTNLTDDAMSVFVPNAGTGPKITAKFKSKLFSFADVVVDNATMTLYQISEPLGATSSGLYGTDYLGSPVNDPLPDTIIDPVTGENIQTTGAEGTPALLDKFTITKPDLSGKLLVTLTAPATGKANASLPYTVHITNNSTYGLNGTQVVLALPAGVHSFKNPNNVTLVGNSIVVTLGRLEAGASATVKFEARVNGSAPAGSSLQATATVRSSTAQPVSTTATTSL